MKTRNFWLMVAMMAMAMQLNAQQLDTIVFEHPDKVIIGTYNDQIRKVVVEKSEDSKSTSFEMSVYDDPVVIEKHTKDWDFNIPFVKKEMPVRRHRNEARLSGLGIGWVTALNAPEGMNVDMGASYEFMGPRLEWRYYPNYTGLSFSWGVGLNWKNYRMTGLTRFVKEDNQVKLADYPEGAEVKFSRLKVFSWTMPFMLNYDFNRKIDFSFGPVLNFNTHASLKTRYTLDGKKVKETAKDLHQNRVTVDLLATFGVGSIGIYAKYSPCKVLNTDFGPDFRGFSAGMTIWW